MLPRHGYGLLWRDVYDPRVRRYGLSVWYNDTARIRLVCVSGARNNIVPMTTCGRIRRRQITAHFEAMLVYGIPVVGYETQRQQYLQPNSFYFMNVPVFHVAPSAIATGGLRIITKVHIIYRLLPRRAHRDARTFFSKWLFCLGIELLIWGPSNSVGTHLQYHAAECSFCWIWPCAANDKRMHAKRYVALDGCT